MLHRERFLRREGMYKGFMFGAGEQGVLEGKRRRDDVEGGG